jgi:hypothetical protein
MINQLTFGARKIGDVSADDILASELCTFNPAVAQREPQSPFSIGLL